MMSKVLNYNLTKPMMSWVVPFECLHVCIDFTPSSVTRTGPCFMDVQVYVDKITYAFLKAWYDERTELEFKKSCIFVTDKGELKWVEGVFVSHCIKNTLFQEKSFGVVCFPVLLRVCWDAVELFNTDVLS